MTVRHNSRTAWKAAVAAILTLLGACSSDPADPSTSNPTSSSSTVVEAAATVAPVRAYTENEQFVVEWGSERLDFLAGVNLGVTVPGHYPGELAIDAETYRRWFPMMTELGIDTIRVYTIQQPHFYQELASYNLTHPDDPLLLIHGVWIDEERLLETNNLFDSELEEDFRSELSDAVAAVTGSLERTERPGRASGRFTADVTPWLIGWIVGIELDPTAVAETDGTNTARSGYDGEFFSATASGTPTESWYAAQLDHLAGELNSLGLAMPLAFTNWPTTDPLDHPDEPIALEDAVGIDANNIRPKSSWTGGYFASYHAYPYYPDFLKLEPELLEYESGGRADPYAGYLAHLKRHHAGLPVVIAEFGVSGGIALAHHGALGRHQGAHPEQDQMAINAELMEVIRAEGLAGGLVFEWADEWFKRTWNTLYLEVPPDRRALWNNVLNNEAQFGLLAIEPVPPVQVALDGSLQDWSPDGAWSIFEGDDGVSGVSATHDAAYLYLALNLDSASEASSITVGFDVLEGVSGGLPDMMGTAPEADYAWTLNAGGMGRAQVRASNDPFAVRHGLRDGYFDTDEADFVEGSGAWNTLMLLTSYPLVVPTTLEEIPAESFAVGELIHGSNDPAHPSFDSRATWYRSSDVLELRVPYATVGISDPSSLQALRVSPDGTIGTETAESIGISVALDGRLAATAEYGWEPWVRVEWQERLKVGAEESATAMFEAETQ